MTPLAHRIVKELTLPAKDRRFDDRIGLLQIMDDIHCFEVSEIFQSASEVGLRYLQDEKIPPPLGFLPAPKTWIEYALPHMRQGFLITHDGGSSVASVYFAIETTAGAIGFYPWASRPAFHSLSDVGYMRMSSHCDENTFDSFYSFNSRNPSAIGCAIIYGIIAMINTPRIIGRRQHMPHRGLEKKLIRLRGENGRFPINGWTEIKLEIRPPEDWSFGEPIEAHLTGKRALHFCRSHLRIRNGKIEWVRAHWRGDASLGIKRSRYKVLPEKSAGAAI